MGTLLLAEYKNWETSSTTTTIKNELLLQTH